MKRSISKKLRPAEDRSCRKAAPDYALERITEWERMLEEDPESAPRTLELNWKNHDCIIWSLFIEKLPPDAG